MDISLQIFEAYLHCPTKCWLRFLGESCEDNIYSDWVCKKNESYRTAGVNWLMNGVQKTEYIIAPTEHMNMKSTNWRIVINLPARSKELKTCIHALERMPSEVMGKSAQFFPIRFIFNNKLTRIDKLLISFDAFVLSEYLKTEISHGKIIHGNEYAISRIKTTAFICDVKKVIEKVAALMVNNSPPDLVLNQHCVGCEYYTRCRQKAIENDDLSLLSGMSEIERKKFNNKGIFTVTQLSYTFRPRHRLKKLRNKREKYHHSLKALAIREKKIHIIGSPELKIEGTPVYIDVEGIPDQNFYYLIGVRIRNGESVVQHSLWADRLEDEKLIWNEFLDILATIENPVLVHYGSFETDFLKRMHERYGVPLHNASLATNIKKSVNLLSVIYAQVYFPGYSNGLKDVSGFLGFKWTDTDCSGLLSIMWRYCWDDNNDTLVKEKLLRYNIQDCEALEILTVTIQQIGDHSKVGLIGQFGDNGIVHADSDKFLKKAKWQIFTSPFSSLEYINSAAHWNYQRDRVYARSEKAKSKPQKKLPQLKIVTRAETTIIWESTHFCPECGRSFYVKDSEYQRTLWDILFGHRSLKLRLVKYVFQTYVCRKCGTNFGIPVRFQHSHKYGWNLIAYFFYQVVGLYIPQRTVIQSFNRLFGFELSHSTLHNLKIRTAEYYTVTKQQIIERILSGDLIHIDETRANIKGKSAFVWVLTSFTEVVYFLSESREGEMVHKLLAGFKGVLVSDFYTAYDSINCPQQKCLIHLMRDLNDEVLNFPFDEQLKQIVVDFGEILKPMIETVDRYGLKKYFLKKHVVSVDTFLRKLDSTVYLSDAALKCKDRFFRNKDKLFTFLKYDGIPWNNNNAEHAVKAFAKLRDVIAGSSTLKGTDEYLTLLSICQTCKYTGLDFLDFLKSGERDIDLFSATNKKKRGHSKFEKRY